MKTQEQLFNRDWANSLDRKMLERRLDKLTTKDMSPEDWKEVDVILDRWNSIKSALRKFYGLDKVIIGEFENAG